MTIPAISSIVSPLPKDWLDCHKSIIESLIDRSLLCTSLCDLLIDRRQIEGRNWTSRGAQCSPMGQWEDEGYGGRGCGRQCANCAMRRNHSVFESWKQCIPTQHARCCCSFYIDIIEKRFVTCPGPEELCQLLSRSSQSREASIRRLAIQRRPTGC